MLCFEVVFRVNFVEFRWLSRLRNEGERSSIYREPDGSSYLPNEGGNHVNQMEHMTEFQAYC